jgi:hypothetical protein
MINTYMIEEIGRLEREERVRSLAPIPDFFEPKISQPSWASRRIGLLLQALVSTLPSLLGK